MVERWGEANKEACCGGSGFTLGITLLHQLSAHAVCQRCRLPGARRTQLSRLHGPVQLPCLANDVTADRLCLHSLDPSRLSPSPGDGLDLQALGRGTDNPVFSLPKMAASCQFMSTEGQGWSSTATATLQPSSSSICAGESPCKRKRDKTTKS